MVSLLEKGNFSYKAAMCQLSQCVPCMRQPFPQKNGVIATSVLLGSSRHHFSLDYKALWVLSLSSYSLLLLSLPLPATLSLSLPPSLTPSRTTQCPEEYSAVSSTCFKPTYFVYTFKYQPFTFSTKLLKFPGGLRLFHDKYQKDK